MKQAGPYPVIFKDGRRGYLNSPVKSGEKTTILYLDDGREIQIPTDKLVKQEDNSYFLPLTSAEFLKANSNQTKRSEKMATIPVIQEEVQVSKPAVETGRVQIEKKVTEHDEVIDQPLLQEEVEVRRVPVGREVDGPVDIRREGDELIIPVLEEFVVVQTKLRLVEELHVRKHHREIHQPQRVTLRREEPQVRRIPAEKEAIPVTGEKRSRTSQVKNGDKGSSKSELLTESKRKMKGDRTR